MVCGCIIQPHILVVLGLLFAIMFSKGEKTMKQVGLWFENLLALGFWGSFFYINAAFLNVSVDLGAFSSQKCSPDNDDPVYFFFFWSLLWIIGGAAMFYYWFKVWRQKNIAERGLNLLYLLMFAIGWIVLLGSLAALSSWLLGDNCNAFWAE